MTAIKNKDERTRNWTFAVYPDSAPNDWRDDLDGLHVPWVESPLHDKDTNPDGEIKNKHWYIAMFFNSKKSYQQMSEITQSANVTMGQISKFQHNKLSNIEGVNVNAIADEHRKSTCTTNQNSRD